MSINYNVAVKNLSLPKNQCKTVAIETGIQNIGVAFLIIFTNLPSPEADFAALPLIAVATLTNLPLVLIYFLRKLYKCFRLKGARNKKSPNKYEKDDLEKAAKSEEEAKPMVVAIRI